MVEASEMLWIVALGIATGARSMTAIAVVCWFAWMQLFPLIGTWAFWTGSLVSVVIFSVLALGEYVGDTLPKTPSRTAPGPLGARLVFGGLVGAIAATALMEPKAGGVILGLIGVLIGAYGGVWLRVRAGRKLGRDLPVALAESAVVIGLSVLSCWHLHVDAVAMAAQEGRTFF